jgi:hypothetical protein
MSTPPLVKKLCDDDDEDDARIPKLPLDHPTDSALDTSSELTLHFLQLSGWKKLPESFSGKAAEYACQSMIYKLQVDILENIR